MRSRVQAAVLRALRIAESEADPDVRGFDVDSPAKAARLQAVGQAFITGYNATLETPLALVPERLTVVADADRGFAFEGAAMAMAILDTFTPQARRLSRFVADGGAAHTYMVHVGAGWALARLHRRVRRPLRRLDPVLGWLAVDGYGFHEGYFHPDRTITRQRRPRHISGYAARAFDQGLGRSLWFARGADVGRVAATIASFPAPRRNDLWAGIGLAAAYAGAIGESELADLRTAAGKALPAVGQGAAFAAQARRRAGNPTPHTDLACRVLCGLPSEAAADLTDRALADAAGDGAERYEAWRQGIAASLTRTPAA